MNTYRGDEARAAAERLALAWLERIREPQIIQITLHEQPSDFPDGWVVRATRIDRGRLELLPEYVVFDDAGGARAFVGWYFPMLALMSRHPDDPPSIVCRWI